MRHKPDRTVNLIGKKCPFTLLEIGTALKAMQRGQVLEILSDSSSLAGEVEAWCGGAGEEFMGAETGDGVRIHIRKA